MRFVFQYAKELFRTEDGANFDMAVFFDDVEPLPGFEFERLSYLLWYYDLVFG